MDKFNWKQRKCHSIPDYKLIIEEYRVFNLKVTIFNHRLQTLVFQISCSSLRFRILTWVHLIFFARFGIFNKYIKIFNQSQSDNSITKIRSKKIYFKLWPLWSCLKIVSRLLSSKRDFVKMEAKSSAEQKYGYFEPILGS